MPKNTGSMPPVSSPTESTRSQSSIPKAPPLSPLLAKPAARKSGGGSVTSASLQAEISARSSRRSTELSAMMSESAFSDRPSKPDSLKATDSSGESLTAHHMLPHSEIKSRFQASVASQDLTAMRNISTFAGQGGMDSSDAFRALSHFKPHKGSDPRREQLTEMYEKASWDSNNVFMGPTPDKRTDDPGDSGVDVRYTGGKASGASTIAQDIHSSGFGGINPQDMTSRRAASKAQADTLRPYKSSDWASDGQRTTKKGATVDLVKQKRT